MNDRMQPLADGLAKLAAWQQQWPAFEPDASLQVAPERMTAILGDLAERLQDNYPFFHPLYAGQMLKPPHQLAWTAYAMAMTINPNNHALDGGAATAKLEMEAVGSLAAMVGFAPYLGHLTSSGTIANLEALWISRELHPDKGIAASQDAHYTHGRMADVLRMPCTKVPTDDQGRIRLDALEAALATGTIGTVVATAGTTSIGAIDPIEAIVPLARRYGARVHVDSAHGGFYRLLAEQDPPAIDPAPWKAIAANMACSPMAVAASCSGTRRWGASTNTTRPTPISRARTCTWARSAWSAHGPEPPPPPSGRRCRPSRCGRTPALGPS
jgi:hypothetical protein